MHENIERQARIEAINNNIDSITRRFGPISFDVDGVLADSAVAVCSRASEICGLQDDPFLPTQIDRWQALRHMSLSRGLSEQVADQLEGLWFDAAVLLEAPPIHGAIPLLDCFSRSAKRVGIKGPLVITSRNQNLEIATHAWFAKHFPTFDMSLVIVRNVSDPDISGELFKAQAIRDMGVGLHFEDSSTQVDKILEISPETHIVFLPYAMTPNTFSHPRVHYIPRKSTNMWEGYNFLARTNINEW